VDVEKPDKAMLARVSYAGSGNFALWNYDTDGEQLNLLVNTIGIYTGTIPIDFLDNEHTGRFKIEARGNWEIELLSIEKIRREKVPSLFTGYGNDVVFLDGNPDLLKIDASKAKSNFVIWSYGDQRDLLVNDIAPYTGVVIVPRASC